MKAPRSTLPWLLAPCLLFGATGVAQAQDATNKAAAEALFQEGRKLFDAGNYPAACAKLLESQKLDPAPGTLLNLGGCYEKNGQTASAWATFKQAVSASHQKGRSDWEDLARTRAAALEPNLSHLTITVAATTTTSLEVKRDGAVVDQAELGSAIPVDPGSHDIEANQPGRTSFHRSVDVSGAGANVSVSIPELDAGGGPLVDPTGPDPNRGKTQRLIGLVVTGAGVVGLGVGAAFGLVAMNKENDALAHDCNGNQCNGTGVQLGKDAQSSATASTIAFTVGAVAAAAGLTIFFLAPKANQPPSVGLRATAALGAASLGLVGSF